MRTADRLLTTFAALPDARSVWGSLTVAIAPNGTLTRAQAQTHVGPAFEVLAHDKVQQTYPDQVVVSPDEMDWVYEVLSPTFRVQGVRGDIRCDGLRLTPINGGKRHRIDAVLEYKSSRDVTAVNPNQLVVYTDREAITTAFGLSDTRGRQRFGRVLQEAVPGVAATEVDLNPRYVVEYVVPWNSQICRAAILGLPDNHFPMRGDLPTVRRNIAQRVAEPLRTDFNSWDFHGFFTLLQQEAHHAVTTA